MFKIQNFIEVERQCISRAIITVACSNTLVVKSLLQMSPQMKSYDSVVRIDSGNDYQRCIHERHCRRIKK